jgi:hypothetical protein
VDGFGRVFEEAAVTVLDGAAVEPGACELVPVPALGVVAALPHPASRSAAANAN